MRLGSKCGNLDGRSRSTWKQRGGAAATPLCSIGGFKQASAARALRAARTHAKKISSRSLGWRIGIDMHLTRVQKVIESPSDRAAVGFVGLLATEATSVGANRCLRFWGGVYTRAT